ncbi:AAEL012854-PA, partial [Aedes aegypti]
AIVFCCYYQSGLLIRIQAINEIAIEYLERVREIVNAVCPVEWANGDQTHTPAVGVGVLVLAITTHSPAALEAATT